MFWSFSSLFWEKFIPLTLVLWYILLCLGNRFKIVTHKDLPVALTVQRMQIQSQDEERKSHMLQSNEARVLEQSPHDLELVDDN